MPDTYSSLVAGYTVLWVILGLYIISLGARVRRIERKAEEDQSDSQV